MGNPIYIVVTPFFPSSENWRGAYCYDFVKALMRTGRYDVRVFVPGNDGEYDYQGVHVTTFKIRQLPSGLLAFLLEKWNARSFLKAVVRSGVEIANVAVCHGHTATFSIYPLAVKKLNPRCKTLLHHHDPQSFGLNTGFFRHFWLRNAIEFPIYRSHHEKVDCHVFISKMVERSFMLAPDASWTEYEGYRKQMRGLGFYRSCRVKQSVVLHNGVDTSRFKPASVVAKREKFTIGCIGNFCDWKDQITLLKAVAALKIQGVGNIVVRLIGSGQLLESCKQYVAANRLSDCVSFEVEVDHIKLPEFYNSLDLFVLPSYFEGFGCVFTEAYACDVPFITCEGQGMDDYIAKDDRGKWLCKIQNANDLANKISAYMKHRWHQKLTGAIGIDTLIEEFCKQRVV